MYWCRTIIDLFKSWNFKCFLNRTMDSFSLMSCGILFQAFGPVYKKLFFVCSNFSFGHGDPFCFLCYILIKQTSLWTYFVDIQDKADWQFWRSWPLVQRSSIDLLLRVFLFSASFIFEDSIKSNALSWYLCRVLSLVLERTPHTTFAYLRRLSASAW